MAGRVDYREQQGSRRIRDYGIDWPMSETTAYSTISGMSRTIRGCHVILASDLAALYGVKVKRLNKQVKRNARCFPADFMFALTAEEAETVKCSRSQFATLNKPLKDKNSGRPGGHASV
jgi:hypothetical protein